MTKKDELIAELIDKGGEPEISRLFIDALSKYLGKELVLFSLETDLTKEIDPEDVEEIFMAIFRGKKWTFPPLPIQIEYLEQFQCSNLLDHIRYLEFLWEKQGHTKPPKYKIGIKQICQFLMILIPNLAISQGLGGGDSCLYSSMLSGIKGFNPYVVTQVKFEDDTDTIDTYYLVMPNNLMFKLISGTSTQVVTRNDYIAYMTQMLLSNSPILLEYGYKSGLKDFIVINQKIDTVDYSIKWINRLRTEGVIVPHPVYYNNSKQNIIIVAVFLHRRLLVERFRTSGNLGVYYCDSIK